ncbi:SEN34 subunit of tRNA-splicing endonuclease [Aaosphaeria arxii CBS 175.79]|uniref:tRNA-splicing endonuclease subunit Sen34 n=1 Tax=Aaosphaeria arxii CBS 175.79 TaxID=1450172 RepID=A0A6A5XA79_9PLEO|nr:SEN34 subunit of tRNA-splicing endonuclease [Aaosphaeria arxii CBS 175.79]KAF2009965.1 SEN34 subunit of tRNA-splicing endonuclease [Aaosphaeria arxii CBS 175.79]
MAPVTEPFPISRIASRYLLFDVDIISHVRRNHNMCGLLVGTIPNLSQQNVFLGIPLELMPEEARVLVEQGAAYIVDDAQAHRQGFMEMSREDRLKFLQYMDQQGHEKAMESKRMTEQRTAKALSAKGLKPKEEENPPVDPELVPEPYRDVTMPQFRPNSLASVKPVEVKEESLFDSEPAATAVSAPENKIVPHFITPTTSHPPLPKPAIDHSIPLPVVPKSYSLYRYVQSKGYFTMPGLRFGCNYSIYPGDPLRFHSHFLGTGLGWDEEFDLLDVIGGGRLANRNKKAYLIGGEDPQVPKESVTSTEGMRVFSIEWVAM